MNSILIRETYFTTVIYQNRLGLFITIAYSVLNIIYYQYTLWNHLE